MRVDRHLVREVERAHCAASLSEFLSRAWHVIEPGRRFARGWHIDAMADHLEALASGTIRRLIINVPPGTTKSTLCMVAFPAWLWGPRGQPTARFIGASHAQELAVRDNRLTRALVTSRWFQERWPVPIIGDQNEKLHFENAAGGFRQACAVSSMTGRRGDIVGWDDPLSASAAHSSAARDAAITAMTQTLPTRLRDPERSGFFIVMQRLHTDDPSGYALARDLGYEHLCIPMEYEPTARVTGIGWRDPRTEPGELLDEERFPRKVVDEYKLAMGSYAYAGQMQQRPSPAGGGIFRSEWWRVVDTPPPVDWRVITVDTAQKASERSDWSVMQCWGATNDGRAVLLDMARGRWEAPELLDRAKAFHAKHASGSAPLRGMHVEDKVSGTGLIQQLRRDGLSVIAIPRNRDKVSRAHDVTPHIEAGKVLLVSSVNGLSDMLAEADAFPAGSHDDTLDPMMDAVAMICAGQQKRGEFFVT